MLTSDLARAQVRQGVLFPRWIDPKRDTLVEDARELIARFLAHVGKSAGELDESIADFAALRTDVVLVRGLGKLLWDRATTGTLEIRNKDGEIVTPTGVRQAVFRCAGERWPVRPGGGVGFGDRADAIASAAVMLGISEAEVESGLYADLADAQRVLTFEAPTPEALLEGYNLALAQACLLKAREVRIELVGLDAKRVRSLMRELKFRRLLFIAERLEDRKGEEAGYRLTLDGPLSLFKQTSRYGLQLALMLPALTRAERWSLEADLLWSSGPTRDRPVTLKLDEGAPLSPSGRDIGVWTSAEEEHFVTSFAALGSPWKLTQEARVVDLDGRDVLIPDYTLTHRDGREALLEIVFAWRKKAFMQRLELLAEVGPKQLVIALAAKGGLDEEPLPDGLSVYRFKGIIAPKKVIELAEQVAQKPGAEPKVARAKPAKVAQAKPIKVATTKTEKVAKVTRPAVSPSAAVAGKPRKKAAEPPESSG